MKESLIHAAHRRRKHAQDISAYALLIAAPVDLGEVSPGHAFPGTVTLPANGRLAVVSGEATGPDDLIVTIGERVCGTSGGAPGLVQRIDWIERVREVEVGIGIDATPGDVSLCVLDEWMRPLVIARGAILGFGEIRVIAEGAGVKAASGGSESSILVSAE